MNAIKYYFINLVLICFFVQISGLFISSEQFRKIFRLVSSIIFIAYIVCFPFDKIDIDVNFGKLDFENVEYEYDNELVKKKFTEEISKMIENDLSEKFNVESSVLAQTDLNKLTLCITLDIDNTDVKKIGEYVRDKYCTKSDEVYIQDEPDI